MIRARASRFIFIIVEEDGEPTMALR